VPAMLRNTSGFLLFLLTATLTGPVHAAEPISTYIAQLNGSLDIGPDGRVQDYSLPGLLASDNRTVVHALDKRIRSWRFEPVTDNGHPVIAHVLFGIELRADAKAGSKGLAVSLSQVQFYDPPLPDASGEPAAPLKPPVYPTAPLSDGVGAKVVVAFKLDEQGRILEHDIIEMDLLLPSAMGKSREAGYAQDFRKATLAATQDWAFPASSRRTCGKPCLLEVPVQFDACGCNFWSGLRIVDLPPLPWATDDEPVVRIASSGAPASQRQLIDPTQAGGKL